MQKYAAGKQTKATFYERMEKKEVLEYVQESA
jgi:hypothetical protein